MKRRSFVLGLGAVAALGTTQAVARAYGVNGYATRRNREERERRLRLWSIESDGFRAFEAGQPLEANPHSESEAQARWAKGWLWGREYFSKTPEERAEIDRERQEAIDAALAAAEQDRAAWIARMDEADRNRNIMTAAIVAPVVLVAGGVVGLIVHDVATGKI